MQPEGLSLQTVVNRRPVAARIEPRRLLIDFLRDDLGLRSVKRSCDVQVCGTCTVLLDGLPISACCTLAYEAAGRQVLTVEGLGAGEALDPLQKAFLQHGAVQCGFCTPGMLLACRSLLETDPRPSKEQIQAYLRGNLCRCTGYYNIFKAVEEVVGGHTEGEL